MEVLFPSLPARMGEGAGGVLIPLKEAQEMSLLTKINQVSLSTQLKLETLPILESKTPAFHRDEFAIYICVGCAQCEHHSLSTTYSIMGVENLIFLAESFDLIGATTVLGVLYGITFTLYCHCSWQLYLKLQNPDNRRQARITLGYISVVFLCTTGLLAFSTRLIQVAYISHGDFFGGPLVYEETPHSTVGPYFATMGILESIVEVLTMVIQVGH